MNVERLEVGPLGTNAYIVREESGQGVVIDPGGDAPRLIEHCRHGQVAVQCIINTHAHADHVAANAEMKEAFPDAMLCIGRGDADRLTDPRGNLSAMFGACHTGPKADILLDEGGTVEFGSVALRVLQTPGHTPGSICLLAEEADPPQLFCGDLVFCGGVGRTDFPGGDWQQLLDSIRRNVLCLPDETLLWPGHGPQTTVGRERRTNPYLRQGSL